MLADAVLVFISLLIGAAIIYPITWFVLGFRPDFREVKYVGAHRA